MAFDLNMIKSFYSRLSNVIDSARSRIDRPLTLTEKILYSHLWADMEVYNRGLTNDKKFFGQHDASWIHEGFIDVGKIMVFNNGQSRGYSSIDIINHLKDVSGNYLYNNDSIFMRS